MAYFTAAEARAFKLGGQTPLQGFTDAELDAAAARIKERFEDICGVAFEETEATVTLDGGNRTSLMLPNTRVSEVTEVTVNDVAFSEDELGDVLVYAHGEIDRGSTYWGLGRQNVSVTYTHGYSSVPANIKWAALRVAVAELTDTDYSSRFLSRSDDMGTTRLSVPGGGSEESWYGIPQVDAILRQFSEQVPSIG